MAENDGAEQGGLGGMLHKVKDAVTNFDADDSLMNQAAAMPGAASDLNFAGGESPASTAGVVPGAIGGAAGGALGDDAAVGRGTNDTEEYLPPLGLDGMGREDPDRTGLDGPQQSDTTG